MAIQFPNIDPVLIKLGPIVIRYYSLAYIAGIFFGIEYIKLLCKRNNIDISAKNFDKLLTWLVIGIIVGGRLGYVLFYKPAEYLAHPLDIFKTWEGGMSFHGGFLGVCIAGYWFCKKYNIKPLIMANLFACAAPIGIGLGRIGNFINGELYGRITTKPWGVIFPHAGYLPRHASQIYEALLEGLLLFIILYIVAKYTKKLKREGFLCGLFLSLYGCFRIIAEYWREPDIHLGFIFNNVTMGQILSIPMVLVGIYFLCRPPQSAQ